MNWAGQRRTGASRTDSDESVISSELEWLLLKSGGKGSVRNPVQRGQRFHGKGDSNPVKADSR